MLKFISLLITSLILLGMVGLALSPGMAAQPTPPPEPGIEGQIRAAIQSAIRAQQEMVLPYLMYETRLDPVRIANDQKSASVELTPIDPETGQPVPLEPGLAIVKFIENRWRVLLPGDSGWLEALASLPDELMSPTDKADWLMRAAAETPVLPEAAFTGYRLPFAAGTTLYMTQSTHHDAYDASGKAHYAFDFAGPYPSGLFPVHAAKSGVVHMARWTQQNGDPSTPGNYLILRDDTTSPVSYQLYLHFAQDTIPEALRVPGTPVTRGQYLGMADDTGISSGNHVHFHVHLNPDSYWGQSVDIKFEDVDINDGRPRITDDLPYCDWPGDVCTATRNTYLSLNYPPSDPNPPQGSITSPANESAVASSTIFLQGWSADDTLPVYARFRAFYNNTWKTISPEFTTPTFSYTWDICAAGLPDGPLAIALELRDSAGNYAPGLPGLIHLVKNYTCAPAPPACQVGTNQVALFSGADFSGACTTLSTGSYGPTTLSSLGASSAASIQVGNGMMATLFSQDNYTGRGETFFASDPSLADNRIAASVVRSLKIAPISTPAVPRLVWPANGASFSTAYPSLSPTWQDAGGGAEFRVRLDGVDLPWQKDTSLLPAAYPQGVHTWQVQARNSAGVSAWSETRSFTVGPPGPNPLTVSAPYSENFEVRDIPWINSNTWDLTDLQNHTTGGSVAWSYDTGSAVGYDTGAPNTGYLTSPFITISSTGYYLRFWYRYETEGPGLHWDRRWLQITTDNSTYANLLQLSDDAPNVWLQSPAIDLSAYAGQTIRLRFLFETLDAYLNGYAGWFIDDISISASAPPACPGGGEPNNTPIQALALAYGETISGVICPGGDVDYFRFSGQAGDVVAAAAHAQVNGSPLDTYLFLLGADGTSPIAQNDDLVTGEQTDSALQHQLAQSGDYYLKLRAWDHPSAGGASYTYSLNLYRDADDPQVNFLNLASGSALPAAMPLLVQAQASDSASGLDRLEFYWHSNDWLAGTWKLFGSDQDGSDGWSASLDLSAVPEQSGLALALLAYDRAGNVAPAVAWRLSLDRTPPVSALQALPPVNGSTVLNPTWSASDNLTGLHYFDLQVQIDNGTWQDAILGIPGEQRQAFIVGQPGGLYAFRLRATDLSGNAELYPASAETVTLITATPCNALDAYEADDTIAQAKTGPMPSTQVRTLCSGSSGVDQDWLRLDVQAGKPLVVSAHPLSGATSTRLRLYAADGATLLTEVNPSGFSQAAVLRWTPTTTGSLFLQVTHPVPGAYGSSLGYQLYLGTRPIYLPVVGR